MRIHVYGQRIAIYAYTRINFGRCNSIIYTYHAVHIAGGLVKKDSPRCKPFVCGQRQNFQWTVGLIPERERRREWAFDPVVGTNLPASPLQLILFPSFYCLCGCVIVDLALNTPRNSLGLLIVEYDDDGNDGIG